MSNSAIKIDTLAIAKELESAGIPAQQAEAQTRVHAKVFNTLVEEQLATKQDIADVKQDIAAFKQDVVVGFAAVGTKIAKLESDIQSLTAKITVRFGGLLVAAVMVLATIIKLY